MGGRVSRLMVVSESVVVLGVGFLFSQGSGGDGGDIGDGGVGGK